MTGLDLVIHLLKMMDTRVKPTYDVNRDFGYADQIRLAFSQPGMTRRIVMNRPAPFSAKPLSLLLGEIFTDAFAKQGFASRELVTRWAEIVGPDIAAHSEPLKLQWQRPVEGQPQEPATLVLRVEGPKALEIQHTSDVILEQVNRFFGWSAVGRLTLRQAPLTRRDIPKVRKGPDDATVARLAEDLGNVEDEDLRIALARLGASIKGN